MSSTPESEGTMSQTAASSNDLEKNEEAPASPTEFKRPISNASWYLVSLGLFLAAMLYGLDTTIAADVQGPILESLGDIEKLFWVGIGFPMGSVSVILLAGCFYGLFDTKYLIIGSILIFEVGSALCGAAQNMDMMIIGRVIAGIGGAGMYLGALTYISVFTSLKERSIYNGMIGLCWGTGCILGPVIGGGFSVSSATWRWAFYINLPLAAAQSPIYFFLFPKHNPEPTLSAKEKLARIDWVGAVLNAIVFSVVQVVLTFAGSTWKWNSPETISLFVIFGIAVVAFALQQGFSIFTTTSTRLFPVQFLKSRTMLLLYFGTAAGAAGMSIGVYYIPLFFQFTRGDSAIKAAIRLLPFICLTIFAVMVAGAVLPVYGRYQLFYIVAGAFLIAGGALMHTVDTETSTSTIYGYEILMAVGAGLIMQVSYSVAAAIIPSRESSQAIGFINVAQIGSVAIALSISSSIFQNVGFSNLRDALTGSGFTENDIRDALGGAQSAILGAADPATTGRVIEALVSTVGSVWILTIVAGAVSLASGILMKREKLSLDLAAGG